MGGRGSSSGKANYITASSIEDAQKLGSTLGFKEDSLTKDNKEALYNYTDNDYLDLNELIRGIKSEGDFNKYRVDSLKYTEKHLADAISKNKITKNIIVGRGMDISVLERWGITKDNIQSLVGKTIQDKGFMSTSLRTFPDKAVGGGHILLEIKAKAGTNAAYIATHGIKGEQEVLFNKGSKVKVNSVKVLDNGKIKVYADIV